MSNTKSFYLLEPLHSIPVSDQEPAQSWLGRIVQDYRCPVAAYTPSVVREPTFKYDSDPGYTNLLAVIQRTSSNALQLSLLDSLGLSYEISKSAENSFRSRKVSRLRVHQDASVLQNALKDTEVLAAFESWGFGLFAPLYLVVGLLVTDDASYKSTDAPAVKFGGNVDPLQIAGLAAGAPMPFKSSIGGDVSQGNKNSLSSHVTGPRIFAIEYRVIRKRIVQRVDKQVQLKGYGPRGDRTFRSGDATADGLEPEIDLDAEPFSESIDDDTGRDRCIIIEPGAS